MDIVVRIAAPADAHRLVALLRAADEGSHLCLDASDMEATLSSPGSERVFVAEVSERLQGYAAIQLTYSFAYTRPTAELTEMFVLPEFRRTGVGSELMKAAIALCQEHQALELFARVNRSNVGAVKLYESRGLRQAKNFVYRVEYY